MTGWELPAGKQPDEDSPTIVNLVFPTGDNSRTELACIFAICIQLNDDVCTKFATGGQFDGDCGVMACTVGEGKTHCTAGSCADPLEITRTNGVAGSRTVAIGAGDDCMPAG